MPHPFANVAVPDRTDTRQMKQLLSPVIASTLALMMFGALAPPPALGQETDQELRDEIEALKKGQEQILKDLQEIKQALQGRQRPAAPAGPNVKDKIFDIGDNPVRGADTAKLTLVEFTDYQ